MQIASVMFRYDPRTWRQAVEAVTLAALVPGCDSPREDALREAEWTHATDSEYVPGGMVDAMPDVMVDAMPDAMIDAMPDAYVPLPDLTLLASRMAPSLFISRETFATGDCALGECVNATGERTLLRFETTAMNAGTANLVMGPPRPNEPEWEYDSCHMHYHYLDFADYALVDTNGTVVAVGHKQSFCLRDDLEATPGAPAVGFDCNNQGLSVGWADVYSNLLDCQFIDITGIAPGAYQLRIEVNPTRRIAELNYDNNVALFPITVP